MKAFVEYGMDQARKGRPSSLVMMLNDDFRHSRRLVRAPKDEVELEIYRVISQHKDLDPALRRIIEKIVWIHGGS